MRCSAAMHSGGEEGRRCWTVCGRFAWHTAAAEGWQNSPACRTVVPADSVCVYTAFVKYRNVYCTLYADGDWWVEALCPRLLGCLPPMHGRNLF